MSPLSLPVPGMGCRGCEQHVLVVLECLDCVGRCEADHRAGTVLVDYDAATIDVAAITQRLAACYEPVATGAAR